MSKLSTVVGNVLQLPKRLFNHVSLFCIVRSSKVHQSAALGAGVRFYQSSISKYSYIGRSSYVESTDIGAFSSISSNCYIGATSHPLDWVSTSPVFHDMENVMHKNFARLAYNPFQKTQIGNDVWVGYGVMIKAGVSIADGAVIGMGSVVTKNVGPYEVWAGNPARLIKKRFSDEIIFQLTQSKWWEDTDEVIVKESQTFNDVSDFIRRRK